VSWARGRTERVGASNSRPHLSRSKRGFGYIPWEEFWPRWVDGSRQGGGVGFGGRGAQALPSRSHTPLLTAARPARAGGLTIRRSGGSASRRRSTERKSGAFPARGSEATPTLGREFSGPLSASLRIALQLSTVGVGTSKPFRKDLWPVCLPASTKTPRPGRRWEGDEWSSGRCKKNSLAR